MSCRWNRRLDAVPEVRKFTIRGYEAVLGVRAPFPNRHVLLEPVHEFGEQRNGLAAMRRRNADVNGRFADGNDADAMNHLRRPAGMPRGNFLKQPPDFAPGHFGIGFVFEGADGLAVFLTPNHAAKFKPRAGRAGLPWR